MGLTLGSLLDASAGYFAPERVGELLLPDSDMHREILLPLLPAMISDKAIREHWNSQAVTGFAARLKSLPDGSMAPPKWNTADFEIHVTASYQASADARALADTLLSEESLRDLVVEMMNAALAKVWAAKAGTETKLVEVVPPATRDSITILCGTNAARRVRRSTVRTANSGTFIVRRLLAPHWTAQRNRPF